MLDWLYDNGWEVGTVTLVVGLIGLIIWASISQSKEDQAADLACRARTEVVSSYEEIQRINDHCDIIKELRRVRRAAAAAAASSAAAIGASAARR